MPSRTARLISRHRGAAVDAVVTGEGGVLSTLREGATHVSSSTISAALSKRLTAAHAEAGQQFITATVLGRPEAAAVGKLFVLAAGPAGTVDPLIPVLDALGQCTFRVSEVAAVGNVVKLSADPAVLTWWRGRGNQRATREPTFTPPRRPEPTTPEKGGAEHSTELFDTL